MRPYSKSRNQRRGTVTVIVVAFLALLFMLGLTFVFYAIAEADSSKVYMNSTNGGHTGVAPATYEGTPPEPDSIVNQALANLIFGVEDGLPGAFNPLRGHEMARTIYGWDANNPTGNTQGFNGLGRVKAPAIYPQLSLLPGQAQNMINYSWMRTAIPGNNIPELNGMMYEIDNNFYRDPKTGLQNPAIAPPGFVRPAPDARGHSR